MNVREINKKPIDDMSSEFDELFKKYTELYFGKDFDYRWFKAQTYVESTFDPKATSSAKAKGLMQIMPSTFTSIKNNIKIKNDIYDPETNIQAGIWYDKYLFNTWTAPRPLIDRIYFMLASYNGGVRNVLNLQKICPKELNPNLWDSMVKLSPINTRWSYKSTFNYVNKIKELMNY